jgi:hypothetical protein
MTQKQREKIFQALESRTQEATASKKAAREFLVRQGYHTKDGELSPEFGGKKVAVG